MKKFFSLLKHDFEVTKGYFPNLDRGEKILAVAILIYIIYFSWASFLRFDNFYTGRLDLGNAVQAVWNTTHGRILEVTHPGNTENISRLAFHGDFFLIFLAPLYFLWPNPKFLLFIQTVILSLGAVFVYKLSGHILKNKPISLVFAGAFLLNPSVEQSNLYDFHAVVLATTFLLAAFYFMKQKRYGWFLLFAFFAGSTNEQVWAILGLYGIFIVVRALYSLRAAGTHLASRLNKEVIFGAVFTCTSFLLFYLFFSVAPGFYGKQLSTVTYFADYSNNPASIIGGIPSSPSEVLSTLVETSRRAYIRQLFLPLGYLSIFSPLYLIFAFPDLIINLLSSNANFRQIYYQYTATITPFLFISAIYGVRLVRYFIPRLSLSLFTVLIMITTIYSAYLYGPLLFSNAPNTNMFTPRPQANTIAAFLKTIPENASVSASNQLGSHLSTREAIYTLPIGVDKAEYVLFLLSDTTAVPSIQAHRDLSDILKNSPNHILIFQEGDFIVFKKNRLSSLLY